MLHGLIEIQVRKKSLNKSGNCKHKSPKSYRLSVFNAPDLSKLNIEKVKLVCHSPRYWSGAVSLK